MLHLGEPIALYFNGTGITKFLKDWDSECEEYRLTDTQKCRKLPRYCCDKDIGEMIQYLKRYINDN